MSEDTELPQGAEFVGTEQADIDPYPYVMADVARAVGHHRVTILRMEQRNIIPKAKWRKLPQPHRVYSKADIEQIRAIIETRHRTDRNYVEDVVVVEEIVTVER